MEGLAGTLQMGPQCPVSLPSRATDKKQQCVYSLPGRLCDASDRSLHGAQGHKAASAFLGPRHCACMQMGEKSIKQSVETLGLGTSRWPGWQLFVPLPPASPGPQGPYPCSLLEWLTQEGSQLGPRYRHAQLAHLIGSFSKQNSLESKDTHYALLFV